MYVRHAGAHLKYIVDHLVTLFDRRELSSDAAANVRRGDVAPGRQRRRRRRSRRHAGGRDARDRGDRQKDGKRDEQTAAAEACRQHRVRHFTRTDVRSGVRRESCADMSERPTRRVVVSRPPSEIAFASVSVPCSGGRSVLRSPKLCFIIIYFFYQMRLSSGRATVTIVVRASSLRRRRVCE